MSAGWISGQPRNRRGESLQPLPRAPGDQPDQIAQERRIRSLPSFVGGEPRKIEENRRVGLRELDLARRNAGRTSNGLDCGREPDVHAATLAGRGPFLVGYKATDSLEPRRLPAVRQSVRPERLEAGNAPARPFGERLQARRMCDTPRARERTPRQKRTAARDAESLDDLVGSGHHFAPVSARNGQA